MTRPTRISPLLISLYLRGYWGRFSGGVSGGESICGNSDLVCTRRLGQLHVRGYGKVEKGFAPGGVGRGRLASDCSYTVTFMYEMN